jgi:hemin uptake protein HemP
MIRGINNISRQVSAPMNATRKPAAAASNGTPPDPAEAPRTLSSAELFAGSRMVVIEHAGQQYRLLVTRNDRLILQK